MTFHIELAKSGRAACKGCKEKIPKGAIRAAVTTAAAGDYDMTTYRCLSCVKFTSKLLDGDTVEKFVMEHIYVRDGEDDFTEEAIRLATEAKNKPRTPKSPKMEKLRKKLQEASPGKGGDDGGPRKKIKLDDEGGGEDAELRAFELYGSMKLDGLKDYCRWNDQVIGGTKDTVLARVIDMAVKGRIKRCTCGGKPTAVQSDENKLVCSGSFDEELNMRVPCSNRWTYDTVPRLPFVTTAPSDEEKERIVAENKGECDQDAIDLTNEIAVKAERHDLSSIDLSTQDGKKEASAMLLTAARQMKLKLPEDEKEAKIKVGSMLMASMGDGVTDCNAILTQMADKLGRQKTSEQTAAVKEQAAQNCDVAANGEIFNLLKELQAAYIKQGNYNAGNTYNKAASGIADCKFEITLENVKHCHKKGHEFKVENIGAGTMKKIKEFLETGKCEKLEEKKLALGL